jgi:hypothetical protein
MEIFQIMMDDVMPAYEFRSCGKSAEIPQIYRVKNITVSRCTNIMYSFVIDSYFRIKKQDILAHDEIPLLSENTMRSKQSHNDPHKNRTPKIRRAHLRRQIPAVIMHMMKILSPIHADFYIQNLQTGNSQYDGAYKAA